MVNPLLFFSLPSPEREGGKKKERERGREEGGEAGDTSNASYPEMYIRRCSTGGEI